MRNKIWLLVGFAILSLTVTAQAQDSAIRPLVLRVSNGGFISFKSETSSTDSQRTSGNQAVAGLIFSQALAGENRIIHRILTDADERVIFGYDLWVNADPLAKKFSVAVLPADDAFRRSFLKPQNQRPNGLFATFPSSTKAQLLDDGDAVSLELLVSEKTGVKIVDVVRVTFDRSRLIEKTPESVPRDFTLDAVSLAIKNYELFIDGELAGKGKSSVGFSGSLLWFYVPDRGRFILSLVPRDGYSFQKIGVLEGNRIEFVANGKHYEWISSASILPNGGVWNLWILEDISYSPLFGTGKAPRPGGPNVIEKLNDVINLNSGVRVWAPRSPEVATPPKKTTGPIDIPQRIMVGSAVSMDHLLPKSP
jgi:hypothetical protein